MRRRERGAVKRKASCGRWGRAGHPRPGDIPAPARYGPQMADLTLDLRGLKCPLPALRARKALTRLAAGELLVVECTDPLAEIDIPNLLRETGDLLEATDQRDDLIVFRIRKAG
jgi:tRNA 2-thiouridine synthesizing protein A